MLSTMRCANSANFLLKKTLQLTAVPGLSAVTEVAAKLSAVRVTQKQQCPTMSTMSTTSWMSTMTQPSHISDTWSATPGMLPLSNDMLQKWDNDGMLLLRGIIPPDVVAQLSEWCDDLVNHSSENRPWILHEELVAGGETRVCRVENYCKSHEGWGKLCFGIVQDCVSQVLREPAVLFKDKINFKGPGGGGFFCHQDATAYGTDEFATRHVSVLVAIDKATSENGALQVAPGLHNQGVIPNKDGVTLPEIEAGMEFVDILIEGGDLVLFDSFLPHKSQTNKTNTWRRSGYLTFNKVSEGNFHEEYYKFRAQKMEKGHISVNKDFAGTIR